MKRAKLVFLAKSDQLKIVMLCLWLLAQVFIFYSVSFSGEERAAEIGGWLLTGLLASLPFALYFFSGQSVTVDIGNRIARKTYVLMGVPAGRPSGAGSPAGAGFPAGAGRSHKALSIQEVFLIPEMISYASGHRSKEAGYALAAGSFSPGSASTAARSAEESRPIGARRAPAPARGAFRGRAARGESYFILRHDISSFKKAEALARRLARRLDVPARVYWGEIRRGEKTDSKSGSDLDRPFQKPRFIQELEESPLMKAIAQKRAEQIQKKKHAGRRS